MKSIIDDICNDTEKPDLVIMNSGCWDLTRYGHRSMEEYKKNLPESIIPIFFFKRLLLRRAHVIMERPQKSTIEIMVKYGHMKYIF